MSVGMLMRPHELGVVRCTFWLLRLYFYVSESLQWYTLYVSEALCRNTAALFTTLSHHHLDLFILTPHARNTRALLSTSYGQFRNNYSERRAHFSNGCDIFVMRFYRWKCQLDERHTFSIGSIRTRCIPFSPVVRHIREIERNREFDFIKIKLAVLHSGSFL